MRLQVILIAGVVGLVPLQARADWAYTKWGMTPEQVAKASGGVVKLVPQAERREAVGRELDAEGDYKDGNVLLHVGFGFNTKTHGLICVFYSVADATQNDALKDQLTKRYGKPGGNEIAGLGMWHWSTPDSIDMQSMGGAAAGVQHCQASAR